MSIIESIFSYYYSCEFIKSETQLKADFEDYPPKPLKCVKENIKIRVIKVRGIGNIYNIVKIIKSIINTLESDPKYILRYFHGSEINVQIFMKKLEIIKKFKLLQLLILMFIPIWVPLLFYFLYKNHRQSGKKLGFFIPISKNEHQITLFAEKKNQKSKIDAIVSHEHIHVLQNIYYEKHYKKLKFPENIILEKKSNDKSLLYIMEKMEVEARLHEIVLSFYRVEKYLPLTIDTFIKMLAGSESFGYLIVDALKYQGCTISENYKKYKERSEMFSEQMLNMLFYVKDEKTLYRFISEVLTVMYGNLLKYYGDDEISVKFQQSIQRPNFYDELYI